MKDLYRLRLFSPIAFLLTTTALHGQTNGTWDGGGTSAIWGGNNNWNPNEVIANGTGATATFASAFGNGRTVLLNTNRTIGHVVYTDPGAGNAMTLSWQSNQPDRTLTLNAATDKPSFNVTQTDRTLTVTARLGGSNGFAKIGPGTMILDSPGSAPNHTVSGSIVVEQGILSLGASVSIANISGIELGGGTFDVSAKAAGYTVANLSGHGSVTGTLAVSTELSPGTSAGTIDFEDLQLSDTSTYLFELTGGGTAADLGNISGTLGLNGASLDLVQLGTYTLDDKFTPFSYASGSLTGTFAGLNDGDTLAAADGLWRILYADPTAGLNGGTGDTFVTITAIPEPSAAFAGALGIFLLMRRRRS